MLQPFHVDKAINTLVEGLAEDFIKEYYLQTQRLRVEVYENSFEYLEGKRGFDKRVSTGDLWEVKNDVKAWHTPNVFVERTAFAHSKSSHYLYFVHGWVVAMRREQIASLIAEFEATERHAGDGFRAIGVLVPASRFFEEGFVVRLSKYV